jgi:N-acetylglucosamine-6-phosphate deacetylase
VSSILLAGAKVVTPDATLEPGWVQIRGEVLTAVGAGAPPRVPDLDLTGHVVVPGFVDVHVHGGGGAAYTSGDPEEAARAAALHLRQGTTSTMASLVTAGIAVLERQVSALADVVEDGLLAGLHLEGPWLSRLHCGAHEPALLRAPDLPSVRRLLRAGRGAIRMVTVAPELDGALDAIREIVGAGAVAAVGHTDATYDQTRRAIDAGATVATHLFNAMRPVHHREPGPVLALLEDPRVHVELIADGVHLHPATLRHAASASGPGRALLVTDAMAAAGATDGDYRLGDLEVRVTGGVARLRDGGAVAGSTLTMDVAVERAVATGAMSLAAAAAAASTTPAGVLGLAAVGSLREGGCADLVVLDRSLHTVRVMRAGRWVRGSGAC